MAGERFQPVAGAVRVARIQGTRSGSVGLGTGRCGGGVARQPRAGPCTGLLLPAVSQGWSLKVHSDCAKQARVM